MVVGGTGLYMRASLAELDLQPPVSTAVRDRVERELTVRGAPALHAELEADVRARVHPRDRKRMSTHSHCGKPAETHFSINSRYSGASRLDFVLKTGRTHQIRVHCLSMGHPIVGDPVYTTKARARGNCRSDAPLFKSITRQMLHSQTLAFTHPVTGEDVSYTAPIPDDMQNLIDNLPALS